MKMTKFDLQPIGSISMPVKAREDEAPARTKKQVAVDHGLHPGAIWQWKKRHPKQRDLPDEEIAKIIASNKGRKAAAKRIDGRPAFARAGEFDQ